MRASFSAIRVFSSMAGSRMDPIITLFEFDRRDHYCPITVGNVDAGPRMDYSTLSAFSLREIESFRSHDTVKCTEQQENRCSHCLEALDPPPSPCETWALQIVGDGIIRLYLRTILQRPGNERQNGLRRQRKVDRTSWLVR